MKKFSIWAVLLLVLALAVTGCGKSDKDEKKEEGTSGGETTTERTAEIVAENDFVAIGPYKGVSYQAVKTDVTAEMVEEEIQYLLEAFATDGEADHDVVEKGDTVIFDFSGIHNGERFDGGTADDYTLEDVGSGSFIPGFEDNLIGKRVGEEFSFDINFPDPYPNNAELSGELVTFEIKIEKIAGEKIIPELTDDFVANVQTYFDAKTVDELRTAVKNDMITYYEEQDKTKNMSAAWDAVTANFTAKKENEEEVQRYIQEFIEYYQSVAKNYEYDDFTAFLKESFNMTPEDFQKEAESYAKVLVTEDAGVSLIAELEHLEITEDEKKAGYEKFQGDYGMDAEAVLNYFGSEENFLRELLYDKVTAFVYENANPTVVEQEAEEITLPQQ